MSQQLEVLLYGLGGIGSFYAFILSRCKNVRLTVVARSNYDAVKANGFKIRSQNHGEHDVIPYKVVKTPAEAAKKFDFIVCAHKAINQDKVPAQLEPAVDENTTIVLMQNGVGNEDPFRAAFPKCTILSCVVWVGALQHTPGITDHTKSENTQIGLFPNPSLPSDLEQQRLNTFVSLFKEGGTPHEIHKNIQIARWEKVIWNVAWNGITTLTNLNTQEWFASSSDAIPLSRRLMSEVVEVARAAGVPIDDGLVDRHMEKILGMPGTITSMQTDMKNGTPLELDVILGVPVRKGRELGVKIPTLEAIYVLLVGVDRRIRGG